MASADVLVTALEHYSPKLTETFFVQHPLFRAIFKEKHVTTISLEGTKRTFAVMTGGPGTINKIVTGSEPLNGGHASIGAKGEEAATRAIYVFDVPNIDLDLANGEEDIVRLLEKYPEAATMDFHLQVAKQLAMGNGAAGVNGIMTFNGLTTYTPEATAKTGMFEYAARTSQNDTVFGLVKESGTSGIPGWYNQYADITTMASDGLRQLRKVLFAARRQGVQQGDLDLGFCDEGTYLNYLDVLTDFVQTPAGIENDVINAKSKDSVMFHNVRVYMDEYIDITATSLAASPAADGLLYFLNSNTFELFHASHNKYDGKSKPNIFRFREPFRHPTQDMMRFEIVLHANIVCNNLRANGAVTGGAL